ncbi:hypothetical protein [Ralstonia solanacearum]|uniref:hypothetical protein n=1 Tax=Ralstonia solanacearum TaxID=305 RepID=UPI000BE77A32|nr:hypothetical protein [Ralstonia solanacearum]ATJ85609.1 hypothetical protein CDC59_04590 [Ralstonia solanacearum]
MLAKTTVLIKTDDGREALSARRHALQVRQRHLLTLINGARTVEQLQQLLSDWPDLDTLLAELQRAGMIDVLDGPGEPETAAADPLAIQTQPGESFDAVAYFDQPLLDGPAETAAPVADADIPSVPPLEGMTLGLQTQAAPVGEPEAANEPLANPAEAVAAAAPAADPAPEADQTAPVPSELADVLPSVIKVELMRLAIAHFGQAAGTVMPLLRACREDTSSLCRAIAVCGHAATSKVGEHTAARFVDAALHALAQRRS